MQLSATSGTPAERGDNGIFQANAPSGLVIKSADVLSMSAYQRQ